MTTAELSSSLSQFVAFTRSLKGDEKSEAQLFLDHFLRRASQERCWRWSRKQASLPGEVPILSGKVQEAGATLEFRIAKKPGSSQLELIRENPPLKTKGGKKFADLLWPERVLIEMKSRGENLEKHYDQAFEYWTHIVPHRPPFVILCNFDEFCVYDFNTHLSDPVERLSGSDIASQTRLFGGELGLRLVA